MDMSIFISWSLQPNKGNIPDSNDSDEDSLYANCDTVIEKPLKKGRNLLSSGSVENV